MSYTLEVRVETDYEFCKRFDSKGEMEIYIQDVIDEINEKVYEYYFNLTIEVIGYVPWYEINNDPYVVPSGFPIEAAADEFAIRYSQNHPCQPRDIVVMFSGRQFLGGLGLIPQTLPGHLKLCDSPEYGGYRSDFAFASSMGAGPGPKEYQIVAHEILHCFDFLHVEDNIYPKDGNPPKYACGDPKHAQT
ncbi:MAG: hypothetical protein IPJ06_17750 [Saprospiraceae bacterium]|nr:hypothetical protein [Saprospiraceae bacterium]